MFWSIAHTNGYSLPSGEFYPKELSISRGLNPAHFGWYTFSYTGMPTENESTVNYVNSERLLDASGEKATWNFEIDVKANLPPYTRIYCIGASQKAIFSKFHANVFDLREIYASLPSCKSLAAQTALSSCCSFALHANKIGFPCTKNIVLGFQLWHTNVATVKLENLHPGSKRTGLAFLFQMVFVKFF